MWLAIISHTFHTIYTRRHDIVFRNATDRHAANVIIRILLKEIDDYVKAVYKIMIENDKELAFLSTWAKNEIFCRVNGDKVVPLLRLTHYNLPIILGNDVANHIMQFIN